MAGSERLDPDVGAAQLRVERLDVSGVAQIEHDAALAGVAIGVVETLAGVERREEPRARAFGRLDADHVAAEVGEQAAAQLALLVGEVQHA